MLKFKKIIIIKLKLKLIVNFLEKKNTKYNCNRKKTKLYFYKIQFL